MAVNVTENAKLRAKTILSESNNPELKLRISIIGGGCSGLQYEFSLDESIDDGDILVSHDPAIVVDSLSNEHLNNAQVDFVESISGSQFMINNPNVQNACGCGTSFTLKEGCDKQ